MNKTTLHIRSRTELIAAYEKYLHHPSIARAMSEDRIEVLGMFGGVGDYKGNTVLARVVTKFNKVWILSLDFGPPVITLIYHDSDVHWADWAGFRYHDFRQGDCPKMYELRRHNKFRGLENE